MNKEVKEIIERLKIKSDRYAHHLRYNMSYENEDEDYIAYLLLDYITSLEEKVETEHKAYMGTVQELTETATRIDKALKCIDENAWFCYKDDEEVIDRVPTQKLKDILKGSDK